MMAKNRYNKYDLCFHMSKETAESSEVDVQYEKGNKKHEAFLLENEMNMENLDDMLMIDNNMLDFNEFIEKRESKELPNFTEFDSHFNMPKSMSLEFSSDESDSAQSEEEMKIEFSADKF